MLFYLSAYFNRFFKIKKRKKVPALGKLVLVLMDTRNAVAFYLTFDAVGLPRFKFNPISLHAIGTMFTVAGWIQVASCLFSWIIAAFAFCLEEVASACVGPNAVINNAAAATIAITARVVWFILLRNNVVIQYI
jgi:hypothetical protein